MPQPRRPLTVLAAALATAALLLTGCSEDTGEAGPTARTSDVGATTAPADGATTSSPDDAAATTGPPADDARDSAARTEEPPEAVEVTSADEAFTLRVPGGWQDVSGEVSQEVEVALRAAEITDDFYTNVVVASEDPIEDLEQSVETAAAEVAGEDGSWTMLPLTSIDGEEAPGYVLRREADGVPVTQVQRWVQHDDRLYVLTLSSAEEAEADARGVLDLVMQSWTWSD